MAFNTPSRKYGSIAVAAVVAIVVAFVLATKGTIDRRTTLANDVTSARIATEAGDKAACLRINSLDLLIQKQLRFSLVTTPKLAYYKEHPAELRAVLANTRSEIEAFAPEPC